MSDRNAEWMEVLDQIDAALQVSLSQIVEPAPLPPIATPALESLEQLDQRMSQWQRRLDQTEDRAREVSELLTAEEAALDQCCAGLADLRNRLGNWISRNASSSVPTPASGDESASNQPET